MMVWKCPPLHLPNWSNHWKWKQEMNSNDLANRLEQFYSGTHIQKAAETLRQQQTEIEKYRQVLESIANERIELSHDKIRWQCEDHIQWAKDVLK